MKITAQTSFVRPHTIARKVPKKPPEQQSSARALSPYSTLNPTLLNNAEKELEGAEYKPGEIILAVTSEAKLSEQLALETLESFQFKTNSLSEQSEILRVKLPEGITVAEGLAALRATEGVRYAEPNAIITLDAGPPTQVEEQTRDLPPAGQSSPSAGPNAPSARPNAPSARRPDDLDFRMWALDNNGRRGGKAGADISALDAWEVTTGSGESVIAVIDTGIDYKHPDLADNMWVNYGEIPGDGIDNDGNGVVDDIHGYNAYADNGDPLDDHSHGTHCAGTIGAMGNNGRDIVGVNWRANLMAIKIFNKTGQTSIDAILRGLRYAGEMGVDITNNSWGDFRASEALKEAFASIPNAVHFAAAGNNRNDNDHRQYYPVGHDLPNMVGVAATDRRDGKPSFSNFGHKTVEVAAPGDQIISTIAGGGLGIYSGTSMACPHAAGVAGLILSEFPEATPEEVRDRLLYNSDRVPGLKVTSKSEGRINAFRSLEKDDKAPAAPSDFRVTQSDSKAVKLSWTTTGDDGWCGGAPAEAEVWVSEQPINLENLHEAQKLKAKRPEETGKLVTLEFPTGHQEDERELHFALRMADNVGHRSELKTTSTVVAPAQEIYTEALGPEDGFRGEDDWARIEVDGNWVWTDSPDGKYRNGADSSLISPPVSLEGYKNCRLSLDSKHELWRNDKALMEVSSDGENWNSVGSFHGKRAKWGERSFDLSAYDGQNVQLRVRLKTDIRHNQDGIYVDNFRILGDRV